MATSKACTIESGDCDGALVNFVSSASIAREVATKYQVPTCSSASATSSGDCVGVAAVPPVMFGNAEVYWTTFPTVNRFNAQEFFGEGLSVASGYCYKVTGSTGLSAYIAVMDRCAGKTL